MATSRKPNSGAGGSGDFRQRRKDAETQDNEILDLPGLESIPKKPGPARWNALLNYAWAELETVRDDMQREHDRQSLEWQRGPEGADLRDQIDKLSKVVEKCAAISDMP